MKSYVLAFFLASVLAAVLTPLVGRFARSVGAVATPGGRHVHAGAIPRLGGVAIALACCVPLALAFLFETDLWRGDAEERIVGILLGSVLLCGVGALDDVRGVRAGTKLAFQVFAASLAFAFGLRIQAIDLPYFGIQYMGVFAYPVTVLWIVGITNAVNLIDGLDGLAAGIVFFASATNFVVALLGGFPVVALVMACLMGAVIGFLLYNFNPARIFMGDSGSYFLGYMLATASLAGNLAKASTAVSILVPLIALGVPVFDTLFSILRRFLQRRPIFSADRGHIHHRLIDLGLTHRRAVLALYGASIAFMVAAIVLALGRDWSSGLAILGAAIVMLGLVRFGRYFEVLRAGRAKGAPRIYDAHTERMRTAFMASAANWGPTGKDELCQYLKELAEQTEWYRVSLSSAGETVWDWDRCGESSYIRNPAVSHFNLGDAWSLTFVLNGDLARPGAHAEILLQLIADIAALALSRNVERAPLAQSETRVRRTSTIVERPDTPVIAGPFARR